MLKSLSASLIFSAFALGAQAKPIVITAFPYTIVAPGNYQVASYLNYDRNTDPGTNIIINVQVPGKVVLDLNGVHLFPYSIDANHTPPSDCIDVFAGSDITIENGSIVGTGTTYYFSTGIYVNAGATTPYLDGDYENNPLTFAPGGNPSTAVTRGGIDHLTINNVAIRTFVYGIVLAGVSGATVKNCSLVYPEGPAVGIWDYYSRYGNTYVNNSFDQVQNPFIVTAYGGDSLTQQRSIFIKTPTQ
jgi:hypothetical protein